ncbi:hypothetical protein PR202_ga27160 [Eleusine coracana subsp. coracana]|uniref:Uncharacterized protein n=1 Tax=Eleusine coracana subsp. coracana TaxID=191504 RepID=A0AAV5DE33_ELECO|nr:hypothetical protein PR202_ga27160 [Eleusine coracana subsp. coracana]
MATAPSARHRRSFSGTVGEALDGPRSRMELSRSEYERVCHSSISNTSADHGLLIPNGSYALTANNCIQCKCSANTYQLDCTPVQGNRSCPAVPPCTGGLKLGEMNRTGCGSMCAYSGYTNGASLSIQTTLVSNQTACQKGGARRLEFSGSAWTMSVICFHMVLILIWSL